MKYVVLTDDESKLLEAIENGEMVSVENSDQVKKDAIAAAKNTLNKTKNINIRLSERDLQNTKIMAAKAGLPYQTFLSSVIHRAVSE